MAIDTSGHGTHVAGTIDATGNGASAAGRSTFKEFTITKKTETSAAADAAGGPNYLNGRLLSVEDLARDTEVAMRDNTIWGGLGDDILTGGTGKEHVHALDAASDGAGSGQFPWQVSVQRQGAGDDIDGDGRPAVIGSGDSGGDARAVEMPDVLITSWQLSPRGGDASSGGGGGGAGKVSWSDSGGITKAAADRSFLDLVGATDGGDPQAGIGHGTTVLARARVDGASPSANGLGDHALITDFQTSSNRAGGGQVLMGDGSVRFVQDSVDMTNGPSEAAEAGNRFQLEMHYDSGVL